MQQDSARFSHPLEQLLTQTLATSANFQEALLGLVRLLGEAFLADGCLIELQTRNQSSPQIVGWQSEHSTDFTPLQTDLLNLLRHPAIEQEWDAELLALTDIQTILWGNNTRTKAGKARSIGRVSDSLQRQSSQARAVLAVKTQLRGEANGTLLLIKSQPYQWQEAEVQLLKTLSPQVGIAISQAQLEQQLEQQIRYQSSIDQLTAAIRNHWELDRVLQLAVESTASALGVSRGMVLLLKYSDPLHRNRVGESLPEAKASIAAEWPQRQNLAEASDLQLERSKQSPRADQRSNLNHSFWISDCHLCQQMLIDKANPVVICDRQLNTDSGTTPLAENSQIADIFNLDTMPALLLMPLENQGTVLGCLAFQQDHQRRWLPEELAFARLAAAQLSTAIIQTRTLQQIQAVVQERTAQLQRSLEVQAKLYEKTRQQVEQLRRLNEEREEFLSAVSHELRTPLTSMTLAIRMLRQADLSAERQVKYLDILDQQCIQETNLINDLLALRKLESDPVPTQLQKLDIRHLVRDLAQSRETSWTDKNLKLSVELPDKPLTLYTDPDSLNRILVELLTNAQKYSDPGSTVHLKVLHKIDAPVSQIVMELRNVGSGILPEELPCIFDKFRRCQGVTKKAIQGTGLGLALVKGLVEHLNGTIAASSQPLTQNSSWETCFTLTLPQYPDGFPQAIS